MPLLTELELVWMETTKMSRLTVLEQDKQFLASCKCAAKRTPEIISHKGGGGVCCLSNENFRVKIGIHLD